MSGAPGWHGQANALAWGAADRHNRLSQPKTESGGLYQTPLCSSQVQLSCTTRHLYYPIPFS